MQRALDHSLTGAARLTTAGKRTTPERLTARGLLCAVLLAATVVTGAVASVSITGFLVEAGDDEIFVNWETASEIDNLGFYVWRSQSETTGYVKVPLDAPSEQFIPSTDEFGVGALYEFVDVQVSPGIRYYYKVQDVPASGGSTMVGPESAMIPLPATVPPSATPTTAAPTPAPIVRFWADPAQVVAGSCATVLWQTDNVQEVYFDGEAVTGEGARAFCPCAAETHILRVRFRDGRWQDFTVTIDVTGTCGSGAGESPLVTPAVTPTSASTSGLPTASIPGPLPVVPQPTPLARPTRSLGSASGALPVSSPTPDAAQAGGAVTGEALSPLPSPTLVAPPTRAPVSVPGGAVMAEASPGPGKLWVGLATALLLGSGFVVGGLWLWKRSR
mgnify:FL=1